MIEIFHRATQLHAAGSDFVMVTVVETEGSVPTNAGGRMLVMRDETIGTVGGGALEKDAVEQALSILENEGETKLVTKEVSDLNMECGGVTTLFFEPFFAAPPLFIFGGGHVAKALVPVAASVGFNVTVVDNREEFADPGRFDGVGRVLFEKYADGARSVPNHAYTVVVTHGHIHDLEVIEELVQKDPPLPYIGMIGSKRKVPLVLDKLKEKGLLGGQSEQNIYAPIGLPIGGGSPAEIALSIASELLAVKYGKDHIPHSRDAISRYKL